jgi:hypothetical protein
MAKAVKIYKPTEDEILKNVVNSFEIENIHISYTKAKSIFVKALEKFKKGKKNQNISITFPA